MDSSIGATHQRTRHVAPDATIRLCRVRRVATGVFVINRSMEPVRTRKGLAATEVAPSRRCGGPGAGTCSWPAQGSVRWLRLSRGTRCKCTGCRPSGERQREARDTALSDLGLAGIPPS
ncbi:hypothetical protein NDU88_003984 [Pleurodeles waltl]|uniref:Uncharacterized protein n=1 Tax=Pleurodeles waltl TaxID=8319 RepID=A0AAV7UE26_PLEWA|nr:hypothetical protein NDU88_003984 [Pleurodeles waltl]